MIVKYRVVFSISKRVNTLKEREWIEKLEKENRYISFSDYYINYYQPNFQLLTPYLPPFHLWTFEGIPSSIGDLRWKEREFCQEIEIPITIFLQLLPNPYQGNWGGLEAIEGTHLEVCPNCKKETWYVFKQQINNKFHPKNIGVCSACQYKEKEAFAYMDEKIRKDYEPNLFFFYRCYHKEAVIVPNEVTNGCNDLTFFPTKPVLPLKVDQDKDWKIVNHSSTSTRKTDRIIWARKMPVDYFIQLLQTIKDANKEMINDSFSINNNSIHISCYQAGMWIGKQGWRIKRLQSISPLKIMIKQIEP